MGVLYPKLDFDVISSLAGGGGVFESWQHPDSDWDVLRLLVFLILEFCGALIDNKALWNYIGVSINI